MAAWRACQSKLSEFACDRHHKASYFRNEEGSVLLIIYQATGMSAGCDVRMGSRIQSGFHSDFY